MLHLPRQLPAGYFRGFNADYARLHGVVVRDSAPGIPSIKTKGGATVKKRLKFDHLSTLCVGLDIGSRGNFITALNFDSDRLINMRPVPNTASGVEAMESMILAVLEENLQFRYLLIALESTSFYGVHAANYLSTSDQFKPYDVKVFCLNPKTIANYRKSFTGLGKMMGSIPFSLLITSVPEELRPTLGVALSISPCSVSQDSADISVKRLSGRRTMS